MNLPRNHYQRNSSWNAPYTFSGKEKDVETGYGYFGARYYDSGLSIWLSVDPMSDKYPSMSPYNYCENNPVMLVDPDGREIVGTDGNEASYSYDENGNVLWSENTSDDTKTIGEAMLKTKTGKEQFDKLIDSNTKFTLEIGNRDVDKDKMGSLSYLSSDFQVNEDGTINLVKATITIFEGNIRDYLSTEVSDLGSLGTGTNWASLDGENGITNYIASVAGHEAEHGTSQANLQLIKNAKENPTPINIYAHERVPNIIKSNILWESYIKF